ncbi:DUF349 domain-containing protein [Aestuariimicrobium ganziense]|uniref:DUF349 domain-containing protein n=1 Tax=Aestuariimicrobium ganziense TaxID=2773677 RepID=UPI001944C031|nr:DUF349 domain-containing protein [Aestuariimicrobium ganziense]
MSESSGPEQFGRVEADGTVYVITAEGERQVGQVPDVSPEEAMGFFVRRYQALDTEVNLLVRRVQSGAVSPDDARKVVNALQKTITEANAVGDLQALLTKLDSLTPTRPAAAEARKAARAEAAAKVRADKEAMVAEAEQLATGNDWRGGVNRFRDLLEQWKALPRIDRATDDALWHRFSSARTTYTRRRKAQFTAQNEARSAARQTKEQIIEEARELATVTDWGAGAAGFRDLMTRWKAAGSAQRRTDDQLWATFRGLQDTFFEARNAAMNEQDAEFKGNQVAKEALLDEAEKSILPVTDHAAARTAFRDFLSKYHELGKVPRDAIRPLDDRVRKIEQAVKQAEQDEWKRTDPEARQRASDTVEMFTAQIGKLETQREAAEAKGDTKKAKELAGNIATYRTWLDQAQATLDEFTA